jgi:hypothetical protein
MCTVRENQIIEVYQYFISHKKDGVPFIQAVRDLKKKGVKFRALGHGIEPFLESMKNKGELTCEAVENIPGGVCNITTKGEKECEWWKETAGVA